MTVKECKEFILENCCKQIVFNNGNTMFKY